MGVLEYTGEQPLYVADLVLPEGMLGERLEAPAGGYGMRYLRREVGVDNGWFTYGEPFDAFYVYKPELYVNATPRSDLQFQFWHNTHSYASTEALVAAEALWGLARADVGERRTLFEVPFEAWDTEAWVLQFTGELQQMLMAHDPQDVFRDDREDKGADPDNPHYTEMRQGVLGATPVIVITKSRVARDEGGREVVTRLVEVVKPDPDTVLEGVVNELSLTERLRLLEQLERQNVTPEEWQYVVATANRQNMQRDHHSVRALIEQYHTAPEQKMRRRVAGQIGGLLSWMCDPPAWFMRKRSAQKS